MQSKQNRTYSMWQNTGFMLRTAWPHTKNVPLLCLALAVVTAGQTVAELLIAPAILDRVETAAPLGQLVRTILVFSGIILLLSGLKAYLNENTFFGRIWVHTKIMATTNSKKAGTSYANLLDTRFLNMEEKARNATNSNQKATEAV